MNQSGKYSVTVGSGGCVSTGFDIISDPVSIQQSMIVSNITTQRECFPNSITLSTSTDMSQYLPVWYKDGSYFSGLYPLYANFSGGYELKLMPKTNNTTGTCYTKSNKIDIVITQPPVQNIKKGCGASLYLHSANGATINQIYKWYVDITDSIPLYTSTNFIDSNYSSSRSSLYVSIYDQISGCETSRTKMYYAIDPVKIENQNILVCADGNSNNILLTTDFFTDGTYKWYTVPTGGIPIYSSSLNSYTISKPLEDKNYYVEFVSSRGCNTNRAKIVLTVFQPPVLTVSSSLCEGSSATITALPVANGNFSWYDSPISSTPIMSNRNYIIVPVNGNKTYYAEAFQGTCITTRTAVPVNAISFPTSTFTVSPTCDQSVIVSYTGSGLQTDTYEWNFNGATIISGSGAGPYKLRWTFTGSTFNTFISLKVTHAGCAFNTSYQNFIVQAAPVPSFSISSTYCQNTTPIALTGTPTGGVFSGTGISGSAYTPSTIGTNTITYTYTNPADACVYTAVKTITVNPLPAVSIMGLNTSYCQSSTGVPVTVSPAGGTLSGTGISGTIFTPSTQGQRTISYTYKDANNCSNTTTQSVTVNPVPTASFTGLDAGYCQSSPSSLLTGTPAGGTFSGDGISGNTFTPTKTGTNTITYTYQPNGCGIPAVKTTLVSAQIIPAITVTSSVPLATCGQSVIYTAAWTNINTPTLQWYVNAQPVSGATASTYNRIAAFGDRVSCKASFTDVCLKAPVELMSAVYEQNVTAPNINYLKLDGTDDKVTIPANAVYDLGSGDFTLEAFVIVDVRSTVPTPIVSKRTATQGFVFYLNDNTLTLKIGSTVYTSSTFTSIKDQYLHQVGVSRQNGVITFYLDGRTIGTVSSTLSINSTANLLLGSDAVDASYMKGYIQNVNFSSLANDFTSNAGLQISPRSSTGIIGSWYMTGCSGQAYVKDYSVFSNSANLGAVLDAESSDPVFSNPPKVILYNPGLNTNALSFVSGANNSRHVEIPNNGAYGAFNSNFTIEAFVQGANAGVNSYPTILSKRSASSNGLAIGINNGKVFVSLGSNIFYDNGSYNLNNNNCNHIVLTSIRILNKSMFYVFVNGIQTYSFSMSGYFNTSDPIWIGNDRGTPNVFNASIDEIRIWNSSRTPDQINANRNSLFNSSTPNLIGYYRFRENINSQVVIDGSSLGNSGFLGNSTALDINDPLREVINCYANSRVTSFEETPTPDQGSAAEAQAPSILLYPNPFGTSCRLQIQHVDADVTIHVMDAAGNIVFIKEKHPAGEELVFGEELPQGMYILQCMGRPDLKPVKFIKIK